MNSNPKCSKLWFGNAKCNYQFNLRLKRFSLYKNWFLPIYHSKRQSERPNGREKLEKLAYF